MLSSIDYGLIAIVAFAFSFFGGFGAIKWDFAFFDWFSFSSLKPFVVLGFVGLVNKLCAVQSLGFRRCLIFDSLELVKIGK